jgi:hypothetical protein
MPDQVLQVRVQGHDALSPVLARLVQTARGWAGNMGHVVTAPFRALANVNTMALVYNLRSLGAMIGDVSRQAERGAAMRQLLDSFKQLNRLGNDTRGLQLARELQDASGGAISLYDTLAKTNQALVGGAMNAGQIRMAFQYISQYSKATGKDLEALLQTGFTGLSRGSPMFLDDLGILTKGLDGVKADFDAIRGKNAFDALGPAAQKAEIIRQAVDEMRQKLPALGVASGSMVSHFDKIRASLRDIIDLKLMDWATQAQGPIKQLSELVVGIKRLGLAASWEKIIKPLGSGLLETLGRAFKKLGGMIVAGLLEALPASVRGLLGMASPGLTMNLGRFDTDQRFNDVFGDYAALHPVSRPDWMAQQQQAQQQPVQPQPGLWETIKGYFNMSRMALNAGATVGYESTVGAYKRPYTAPATSLRDAVGRDLYLMRGSFSSDPNTLNNWWAREKMLGQAGRMDWQKWRPIAAGMGAALLGTVFGAPGALLGERLGIGAANIGGSLLGTGGALEKAVDAYERANGIPNRERERDDARAAQAAASQPNQDWSWVLDPLRKAFGQATRTASGSQPFTAIVPHISTQRRRQLQRADVAVNRRLDALDRMDDDGTTSPEIRQAVRRRLHTMERDARTQGFYFDPQQRRQLAEQVRQDEIDNRRMQGRQVLGNLDRMGWRGPEGGDMMKQTSQSMQAAAGFAGQLTEGAGKMAENLFRAARSVDELGRAFAAATQSL